MRLVITKCLSIISQVSNQPKKLFIVVHAIYSVIKISFSLMLTENVKIKIKRSQKK